MKLNRLIGLALVSAFATTVHAQYNVLVYFNTTPSGPLNPGLIAQGRDGYLFTTAPDRSTDLEGVVFRVGTSGGVKVLHEFDGYCTNCSTTGDGSQPLSGLTLGRDGRYYGTTSGADIIHGTIFNITQQGVIKTLYEFTGGDENYPVAPPVQSLYGDFYGTTYGDNYHPGAVYKVDSFGTYTLLHTLASSDGKQPIAPLVQAPDYWFFGAAELGGANNAGTIFRVNSSGTFEKLYNFDTANGARPVELIQANNGNFYGIASYGGSYGQGVVFKMTYPYPFQVTVLHHFTGGSDGGDPLGGLLQASDGNLYGTTAEGGIDGLGVLFRISTTGDFKVLHDFDTATGWYPVTMMQHTNGSLYGETSLGGPYNNGNSGVFFRFDLGLPPFVTFLNCYGRVGKTVQILGQGFTTDSQVFFNGVPAQITELQPTFIEAVVPQGATSGFITVTTTYGTLKSNKIFLVRP